MKRFKQASLTLTMFFMLSNCGTGSSNGGSSTEPYNPQINPEDFTIVINNPLFNLPIGKVMNFKGESDGEVELVHITIPGDTKQVMGVETLIYRDLVYVDGVLVEDTRDYLAQNIHDGSVWYFGEDVDNYEDGKLADHDGAWIAGENGALPGIWIKGEHVVGDLYRQEYLAGEAEDMREVVEIGIEVKVDGKVYADCVKMYDWTPLDVDSKEHKTYCPEAGGLVLEEHLVDNEKATLLHTFNFDEKEKYAPSIVAADFSPDLTKNKYLNLPIGKIMRYEGKTEDGIETIEIEITNQTKMISLPGKNDQTITIEARVYRDRVYLDGEIIEDTLDYLAQHKNGDIWYFGEDVDNYEKGVIADHDGTWLAGKDGALPGIWIKGKPSVGESTRQEYMLGEAEDVTTVLETGIDIELGNQTYTDCVKTLDWSPLTPYALEHKVYCKDVGALVLELDLLSDESVELDSIDLP